MTMMLMSSTLRCLDSDFTEHLALLDKLEAALGHISHQRADISMTNVHKCKGLEFDTVVLRDDFLSLDAAQKKSSEEKEACQEV